LNPSAITDRYRAQGQTVVVRADAAFALPALSRGSVAESYLTRPLFRQIVARIERLAWHPT